MTTKIKRSQFATFLNTTPDSTATYNIIGDGVTTGTVNMNPEVTTETYINSDVASTEVERYAPVLPIEASAKSGDPVFEFVDALRTSYSVLADAQTDIVNVELYKTPTLGEYPAEKIPVSVQVDSFGGDGGTAVKINFTVNYNGSAVRGTFNPTTKAFTPNP